LQQKVKLEPVVLPSASAEHGSDEANVAAEVISAEMDASVFEVDSESIVNDSVATASLETLGASRDDHWPHAESFDPQPEQLQTSAHLLPQGSMEAVQDPGLAIMLLSSAVVVFVGALVCSARSPSRKESFAPSQAACTGADVPAATTWRPLVKVPRSAQLPRVASDDNEGIWEVPLPDAEGTDCRRVFDEPRLQVSVKAAHEPREHKSATDASRPHAVLCVSTPSRARTTAACGQQGIAEIVPRQDSF